MSVRSRLRRFKRLRDIVVVGRDWSRRAGRPILNIVRRAASSLQILLHKDSRDFGSPRYERLDIFDYVHWHGIAETTRIQVLHPRYYMELTPAIHCESEPHYEIERRRARWVPEGYVFELPKGRVIGGLGSLVTNDDHYLATESYEFHASQIRHRNIYQQLKLPKMSHIDGRVASLSSYGDDGNLYHWLHNSLPRLALIREAGLEIDAYYVTNSNLKFVRESLALLGIESSQIIDGKHVPHLSAETLIATNVPGQNGYLEPWSIMGLRDLFLPQLGPLGPTRRLLISRASALQRRLLNEDELWARLEPHGFERLLMETMSFPDQMRALRDAEAVVGLHGANLSCLAFVSSGTAVVEIFPQNYVIGCYTASATLAGAKYAYAIGEGENRRDYKDLYKYALDDAVVDVEKVATLLAMASDGRIRV